MITCTEIARELDLLPIQVRKDIVVTQAVGKPGCGYLCQALAETIERYLGWQEGERAVLLGAGELGAAVLGFEGLRAFGLNVVAAFDPHEDLIGGTVLGLTILPVTELAEGVRRSRARIGIVTCAEARAQTGVDTLVDAGIQGIWNFTGAVLKVPEYVVLENVRISSSLAVLTTRLQERFRAAG
jgi:redox-sensing transcriptional repressor